ncbi:MAG: sulfatase-like hydrolase/transferase [Bacteroidetes bacterium]|nr:sulfatase-like hydrolase/transferase [Bacteroidota bacterium]MDA1119794.1 sulfatase-like hydrolase/transferase [Bacteroidota bacterium]
MNYLTSTNHLRYLLFLTFLHASFGQLFSQTERKGSPPNVILIMADDLGSEAVGCYGGTSYKTPVLDKMAENGIRFEHAYAYPLCTPTRVSLMTGKYNFRNWRAFGILDPKEKTFGHLMQEEGYVTCMVGKWQLQSYDPPGFPGGELRRGSGMRVEDSGFDEYSMWHTDHTEDKGSRYADPLIYQNGNFLYNTAGKYGPDIYTDYLLDFVNRNRREPFFIYYPMALTHPPFLPTPDSEEWNDLTLRHKQDNKFFGDMVEYADKLVGKILDHLEKNNLAENTLVIFYSDNGTHLSLSSKMGDKTVWGGKGLTNDAGTRIPLIVNWKGKIQSGLVTQEMISPSDFIPTIFEAIGRTMPSDFYTDGQSFMKVLDGNKNVMKDWVYIDHDSRPGWDKENFPKSVFVKGTRYKLYDDGRFFDVENDKLEENPLKVKPGELSELKDRYARILDSLRRYGTIGYLESYHSDFDKIVPPYTKIEVIAEGHQWTEGPVWIPEKQMLLYSDIPRNMIYKWEDGKGVAPFLRYSGYSGTDERLSRGSNGLTLDNNGKLLLCRIGDREVARLLSGYASPIPTFQTLAYQFEGKRLNGPNDLTVDKAGNIYFTDPQFGRNIASVSDTTLGFRGVYRLTANGKMDLLTKSLNTPNGIALSPDNKTLYVANSTPPRWMAFDLSVDGKVANERVLFDGTSLMEKSISKQAPDGMTINSEGILFATGPDGVLVFSPEGKHLGTIKTDKRTSNCTLNEDETVLYVTCDDYVLRVIMGYKIGKN